MFEVDVLQRGESRPGVIYISLLIIPCIIYYVTNKETLVLEMRSAKRTTLCIAFQPPSPSPQGSTDHKRGVGPLLSLPEVHDQLFSFAHVQRETVVLAP